MPKGRKGEKRPADVIGNAVRVMRIAMGEMTTPLDPFAHAGAGRWHGHGGELSRAPRNTRANA